MSSKLMEPKRFSHEGDHLNISFFPIPPGSPFNRNSPRVVYQLAPTSPASPFAISRFRRKSSVVCRDLPYRKHVRRRWDPASSVQLPLFAFSIDCRPYADQMSFLWKMILMEPLRDFTISPAYSRASVSASNFTLILLMPVS